jgi:hypothetical protein
VTIRGFSQGHDEDDASDLASVEVEESEFDEVEADSVVRGGKAT